MGSGTWSSRAFDVYTTTTKGVNAKAFATADSLSAQDIYKALRIHEDLSPKNVMRECIETPEHPDTLPVILALDVTGSMGNTAVKVAQKLNDIMTDIYAMNIGRDVEFCVMGIGDLYCDSSPIQISQFESDVRIAEHLDKLYFEFGGGGNSYESYTAAWYMGSRHCNLDCWKRGRKGIIITLGDELPNPYLPVRTLKIATGDPGQADINTEPLLEEVREKFDVYHISVDDSDNSYHYHKTHHHADEKWRELLGDSYIVSPIDNLPKVITEIVTKPTSVTNNDAVSW